MPVNGWFEKNYCLNKKALDQEGFFIISKQQHQGAAITFGSVIVKVPLPEAK